jgi:hypothetical protein
MKAEWINVLKINSVAHRDVDATRLNDDAFWMSSKPVMLLYLVFERGQFNPLYEPFQRLLRSILEALPDSRIVEQFHQWLRDLSRKSRADVSSCVARMNACIMSEVLTSRDIEAVSVSRDEHTVALRGGVTTAGLKRNWASSRHTLPREYAGIMKPGQPSSKSPTPLGLRIPMTALTWLQHYFCQASGFADSDEVSMGSSWFTRFLVPFCLLCRLADRRYGVALPPSSWGTLALRVAVLDEGVGLLSV